MKSNRWILAAAIAAACATAHAAPAPASASGVDLAGIDHSVKPGDDFNGYASGNWAKTAQIPADRSSTGIFLKVFEKAEQRNAELIRDAGKSNPKAGSNERKIADYYAAYMNEAAIEKNGLAPIKAELAEVDAIKNKTDLSRVLGGTLRSDVDPINATNWWTENLFGLFVTQGLEDPSHNVP